MLQGNIGCMRVKIKCEGEKQMITGVNKRHKSEGGTSRVTEKDRKVQLVLKEKVKCTRGN